MKKYLPYPAKGYITKARKCCSEHPIIAAMLAILALAAIAFAIISIVKFVKKEEELLDGEWNVDDDGVFLYPSEDDFVEGE